MNWFEASINLAKSKQPFVIVTVVEVIGSSPREVGARIVVSAKESCDSIGGGHLEYVAIEDARTMLSNPDAANRLDKFIGLGDVLSQCCGGAVRLHFERYDEISSKQFLNLTSSDRGCLYYLFATPICVDSQASSSLFNTKQEESQMPIAVARAMEKLKQTSEPASILEQHNGEEWLVTRLDEKPTNLILFGAGHVGKALVNVLGNLPFQVQWIDSRKEIFPDSVPDNATIRTLQNPVDAVSDIDSNTFCVVMTHSHAVDFEIVHQILANREFGWLGLIGSETKRRRFELRLMNKGIDAFVLKRLHCPVGLSSIRGKHPSVIALSTSAQILEARLKINNSLVQDAEVRHA